MGFSCSGGYEVGGSVAGRVEFEESLELEAPRGMAQFAQCLGLNLPDAFPSNSEALPHLFQGALAAILQSKAHFDDFSSRGVNVLSTPAVCSFRWTLMTASAGETAP